MERWIKLFRQMYLIGLHYVRDNNRRGDQFDGNNGEELWRHTKRSCIRRVIIFIELVTSKTVTPIIFNLYLW